MRNGLLITLPVVLVGVAGGLVSIAARESDAAFVYGQQTAATIEPRQVERAVMLAREPVPGDHGSRAVRGSCRPGAPAERRNPWTCRIRYASGRQVSYRVEIDGDGFFLGYDAARERLVSGCCIQVPRAG
jgi:hypothetical protein